METETLSKTNPPAVPLNRQARAERLILVGVWMMALSTVLLAAFVGWHIHSVQAAALGPASSLPTLAPTQAVTGGEKPAAEASMALPELPEGVAPTALKRRASMQTTIPERPRVDVLEYTVDKGDSVFGIASQFKIKPETLLWANETQLNDNPDMLSVGMKLNIPPVNGVLYEWQKGDSLDQLAAKFEADPQDTLGWLGNRLDLIDPQFEAGQLVMFPGGHREFRQWVIPTIPRGAAGVNRSVLGPGACEGGYDGAYGTGSFAWPTYSHGLSGNDYWSGHLAIDIGIAHGDNINAADSGVVVFAGLATGGYGYMVMLDHGNGYQTLYAHMSNVTVRCGQSVSKGGYLGAGGSSGNSTGPHLHFEVRYQGGFVNPWYVLPPP